MKLRESIDWIRTALTDPVAQLSRWQKSTRHAYRVGRFSLRHLSEDRASQMAGNGMTFLVDCIHCRCR